MPLVLTEKELAGLLKKSRRRLPALVRGGGNHKVDGGVVFLSTNEKTKRIDKTKPVGEGSALPLGSALPSPCNKYKNQKVTYMGIEFDSLLEANRYGELVLMQRAGEISELRRQVEYELIPSQREPDTVGPRGGIKKGKVIERAVCYVADFVYKDKHGNTVVEDTKGVKTPDYTIKRKLMLWIHKIRIKEITE